MKKEKKERMLVIRELTVGGWIVITEKMESYVLKSTKAIKKFIDNHFASEPKDDERGEK